MRNEVRASRQKREIARRVALLAKGGKMCLPKREEKVSISFLGDSMTSIKYSNVEIQTSPQSIASLPAWFGEVAIMASLLTRLGLLHALQEQVQFARRRMGRYEVIDFLAVLFGYALSGEPTLQAFYERVDPFATAFMALFGRDHLPHRSTLSRFLAAFDHMSVEAVRTLFERDLQARPFAGSPQAGLWDRLGTRWIVFDVDATRQAVRQRALPHTPDLPSAQRRFDAVCAKGYLGRKRGELGRSRTTILQPQTHQWVGTFSGAGNGDYRAELLRAAQCIIAVLAAQGVACDHGLVRLDGLYGNGIIVEGLARLGLAWVLRGKEYGLLTRPEIQARLALPATQLTVHPETGTCRALFDFPQVRLGTAGPISRVIIATQNRTQSPIGHLKDGVVSELFFTCLPTEAFTASDVVALYFHRGAFETVLRDEDEEQDPDRWCSRSPFGQECWQILNQWVWNLRLECGHHLHPSPLRCTEFAPASLCSVRADGQPEPVGGDASPVSEPVVVSAPPASGKHHSQRTGKFSTLDFPVQADGTLQCPAGQRLTVRERRLGADGSLRIYYAPSASWCRVCALRADCLREGTSTKAPRRVSLVLPPDGPLAPSLAPLPLLSLPLPPLASPSSAPASLLGSHPIFWRDWGRCWIRRAWMSLLRRQSVTITVLALAPPANAPPDSPITRPQRAHWRLSWSQRVARNACTPLSAPIRVTLPGLPDSLALWLQGA
jgi:hypothetical protein